MWSILTLLLLSTVPCRGGTGCTVDARVQGSSVPLLVDTGADVTVLTAEGARRAGLRVGSDAPTIVVNGAGGQATARLVFARIKVGDFEEPDVLVAVMDDLDLGGRAVGLLGMTYLERFDARIGRSLELVPVDAEDEERRGGRGRTWWSMRFRAMNARKPAFQRAMESAEAHDRRTERAYGRSATGENMSSMMQTLMRFMEASDRRLRTEAARHAVPESWRR